jgi:hypothetical protein
MITNKSGVVEEYDTVYRKLGQRRKRCAACGKLVADGELVVLRRIKTTQYYPVKGLMGFVKWQASHIGCNEGGK